MRYFRALLLASACLLMAVFAGCASTLDSRVTTFQAWPADAAMAAYAFAEAPGSQTASLEQQTYEDDVRNELAGLGLREAAPGETARLVVAVTVQGEESTRQYVEPVYANPPPPMFVPGYYRRGPRGVYWVGSYWAYPYWGPTYLGDRTVTQRYLRATLHIVITDTRSQGTDGKPRAVFDTTATTAAAPGSLPRIVPMLARAALSGFPGENGTVRTVRIDAKTGRIAK